MSSRRTESFNPTRNEGKMYMASNTTARGNVVVYELPNARVGRTNPSTVVYDGPGGGTMWVDADRVGHSPEEAVQIALKRVMARMRDLNKHLRMLKAERAVLAGVISPPRSVSRPNKIVVKRSK